MLFEYYRITYINILLFILFITNQLFLFLLILYYKIPYVINLESEIEYEFDYMYYDLWDIDARYLENDIDNEDFYVFLHMQSYLYANCRFFFDVLGGETYLDHIDFLDFTIYKYNDINISLINRNYKYIYNNDIAFLKVIILKIYIFLICIKSLIF